MENVNAATEETSIEEYPMNAEAAAWHKLPLDLRRYIGFRDLLIDTKGECEILRTEIKAYGIGRIGKYAASAKAMLKQCAVHVIGYGCDPTEGLETLIEQVKLGR